MHLCSSTVRVATTFLVNSGTRRGSLCRRMMLGCWRVLTSGKDRSRAYQRNHNNQACEHSCSLVADGDRHTQGPARNSPTYAASETSNDSSAYLVARYRSTTPTSVLPVARTAATNSRSLQLKHPHQWARLSRSRRFIRSLTIALTLWRPSSCSASSGSWPGARSHRRRAFPLAW